MVTRAPLKNLEIRGFRGFRHLEIPRLASVNLVVGKNGAGKTSLLEALQVYFSDANPARLVDILQSRDEFNINERDEEAIQSGQPLLHEAFFLWKAKFCG